MKISVLVVLCLLVTTVADASPRSRRRAARRIARQPRVQQPATRNLYNNYVDYRAPESIATTPEVVSTPLNQTPNAAIATPSTPTPSTPSPSTPNPSTTAFKPIVGEPVADAEPTTVAMADTQVQIEPSVGASTLNENASLDVLPTVVDATSSAPVPVPDPLPTVDEADSQSASCASCQVYPAGVTINSALAELNAIRAQRGLHPLIEDPSLSAVARRKASIQAIRGAMFHPGGSMGGARFEGVGMGARFTTCYQDATNATYAGAATVTGRNGQRYHCLLIR